MHYMWPYDFGFYTGTDRAMDAREWSDALTRAILRKDGEAARQLFDHTFWHSTDFKPDWFHLYLAVQQRDRAMAQLMVTHGARWSEAQTAIAAHALKDAIKPFTSVLAEGGMRIDRIADTQAIDPRVAIAMDKRLMEENAKLGHVRPEENAALDLAIIKFGLRALRSKNTAEAQEILAHAAGAADYGVDLIPLLRDMAGQKPQGLHLRDVLAAVDDVRAAGVSVRPLALDRLSDSAVDIYTLVPALHERGLLGGDIAALREKMLHSWCFAQETLRQGDFEIAQAPETVSRHRAAFGAAAKIICSAGSDITPDEARRFTDLHMRQAPRHSDAVAHMDATLLESGFFTSVAFTPALLDALAAAAPDETLRAAFNLQSQRRHIEDKGVVHFLSPKRFDTLRVAIRSKAYVPDANETAHIMRYLNDRCHRREVPEEVQSAVRELKDSGANFAQVNVIDLVGAKHPLLAKTMLDMDIIAARDIKLQRLASKIPPHSGVGGMFAASGDKDYARREFLYQVMFERDYPAHIEAMRAKKNAGYQQAYTLMRLRDQMGKIKTLQSPPRPKLPSFPPPKMVLPVKSHPYDYAPKRPHAPRPPWVTGEWPPKGPRGPKPGY